MLEKRNGRIGLKDEGPLHELAIIEIGTKESPEKHLGWCIWCGALFSNWNKPCPRNVLHPLDRCEWKDQDGKCNTEGSVLLGDNRWLCHEHALEA